MEGDLMKRDALTDLHKQHRAAVYVRVSSSTQETDGTSLETQESAARAHVLNQGYAANDIVVYREVFSGVELWERPQLTRMREAIRRKEFSLIIAYAIDRLSRDPVHLGVIISEAEHAGVEVQFVTEPMDKSPEGQLIRFVRGYAAKVEHEKIRERTVRGRRTRVVDKGKPLASQRPRYGFEWKDPEKSGWIESPITGHIARRIWHEAYEGTTLRKIAQGLSQDGTPTPSGRSTDWSQSTIKELLSDPIYMGRPMGLRTARVIEPDGRKVSRRKALEDQVPLPNGTAPTLVEPWIWQAVQERLERNKVEAARNNPDPESALLRAGYIRCGHCGGAMAVQKYSKTVRSPTYTCARSRKLPYNCRGAHISTAILDAAVWEYVQRLILNPELVAQEVERMKSDDPVGRDLEAVERAIAERDAQHRRLLGNLSEFDPGSRTAQAGAAQLRAIEEQLDSLQKERALLQAHRRNWEIVQTQLDDIAVWCRTVESNLTTLQYQQKRDALLALGIQVFVWRQDHEPRWQIRASIDLDVLKADAHPESRFVSSTS